MSDEAVICDFMEPGADARADSDFEWWGQIWSNGMRTIHPRNLTLDALWEVEERLKPDYTKWQQYIDLMMGRKLYHFRKILDYADITDVAHATAAQKIKALATVLRKEENNHAKA